MNNNQTKQKNLKLSTLISMLLIITIMASCVGLYAWAKYITNQNEQASVDIAKWNFELTLRAGQTTVTSPTQVLDLATTSYTNVANGTIAPGTSGEFDIVINTQGTEVSMTYDVTIAISNCPRNITFSRQQGSDTTTLETISAGGTDSLTRTINFSEYLAKEDASGEFVEKIKWNWPYEGTVGGSATTYDEWDTADKGKTARLAITVVGTEQLTNSNSNSGNQGGSQETPLAENAVQNLALNGDIKRGDTINYNPGNGTTANMTLPNGATLASPIAANNASDWVVLNVNETTGEVLIMPETVPEECLTLEGKDGYNNAIQAITAITAIYLNPTYANSVRSLNLEDVNAIEGHTPDGIVGEETWNHRYGMNPTTLDITDTGSDSNTPAQTYISTSETGYEFYYVENFIRMDGWLASRTVGVTSNDSDFRVNALNSDYGAVFCECLFYINSNGTSGSNDPCSYPVIPVVTLKPSVQLNMGSAYYTEEEFGLADAYSTSVQTAINQYEHHSWSIQ